MFMTTKARNLLRQRGMSYEEIMSAEWYMLPEAQKYLDGSMPSNSLELGSNVNQQVSPPPLAVSLSLSCMFFCVASIPKQ